MGARGQCGVVRHEDDRSFGFPVECVQQLKDLLPSVAVEITRRFVGKQHARRVGKGPRDGDALLLAPERLGGEVGETIAEPHAGEEVAGALRGPRVAPQFERHLYIFDSGERGDQLKALEDKANFLPTQPRPLVFVHRTQIGIVQ